MSYFIRLLFTIHYKLPFRRLVVACLGLLLLFATGTSTVQAASQRQGDDPLVAIVKDVTATGQSAHHNICTLSKTVTFPPTAHRPRHTSTHRIPCPAGTFLQTVLVPRSQALAHHEPFVLYPSGLPTAESSKQFAQQVQQLQEEKRQALAPQKARSSTPCYDGGADVSLFSSGVAFGDQLGLDVYYHVSIDCSAILLQQVEVTGWTAVNELWWGPADYYDGKMIKILDCTYVGTRDTIFDINKVEPLGFDYQFYFTSGPCLTGPTITNEVGIGPLN